MLKPALVSVFYLMLAGVSALSNATTAPDKSVNEIQYRTAVSPEFPQGLHRKYLEFIARGLQIDFRFQLLPYARRIADLQSGKLDLLVGIQHGYQSGLGMIILKPQYEDLTHMVFINKDQAQDWAATDNLADKVIAVTIKPGSFSEQYSADEPLAVQVTTLKQKIQLLLRRRVDAFIHFKDSTNRTLRHLNLEQQIIPADYQPSSPTRYYVAIGESSRLMARKTEIEGFISQAVKEGKFAQIREQHYQQGDSNPNGN